MTSTTRPSMTCSTSRDWWAPKFNKGRDRDAVCVSAFLLRGDEKVTLNEILAHLWGGLPYAGGGLFVLLTLIQLAPIQVNPWSWLAKTIGKATGIAAIEKKLDAHIATDDKRDADSHRVKILQFNNELLRSIDHTKEEFIEVLAEIDAYERFCDDHPDYPNNRAVLAIENIRENYKERLKKHDFLQEGEARHGQ